MTRKAQTTMSAAGPSNETRRIGLMGGSFDPVHLGHIHLAILAKEALGLDEVRFIPCCVSPHKQGTAPMSGEDRLELLRLATEDLPWAAVDDFELGSAGPNYSYLTAREMVRRFPEARLFWIMGGDQWDALPRWKHPEILAELLEFIVLPRGEMPLPREGYRMHVVQGDHPASSTEIRANIAEGKSSHPWLHPAVCERLGRESNS